MEPFHPLFALLAFLMALMTSWLINLKYDFTSPTKRYGTLDGLRGFLAISVFIHHTVVWYGYLQTGNWASPDSNLFNQLGQSSVALFFMISSFLFTGKLLNFKGKSYPWKDFFTGRFFRIVPLYVLSFSLVVLTVGILSEWSLREPVFEFLKSLIRWSGLGILGQPDLNGLENTATINSFVNWSLLYEWLLYFSLPVMAIFILKKRTGIFYIFIGILFIIFAVRYRNVQLEHLLSLGGGILAAFIRKYDYSKINYNHYFFTFLTIGSLLVVVQFKTSGHLICKLFLILAFILIAMGNDLFGLLKSNTLKLMGEISYSTYLLHGILIFVMIHFFYGPMTTKNLSVVEYSLFVLAITVVLMILSLFTYHFIEQPFIKKSKRLRQEKNSSEVEEILS